MVDKINAFTFNHSDQPNVLTPGTYSSTELKQKLDSRGEQLRVQGNAIIDAMGLGNNPISVTSPPYYASGSNTATTGSITSGLKALTVLSTTTYAVNQGIKIAGAGVAGAALITSITAIVGLVISLADAASTTVSAAAVTHEDTVGIQAAIAEAILLGKSEVQFPTGTYNYGTLTDTSGLTFIGDGVTLNGTTSITLTSIAALSADVVQRAVNVKSAAYNARGDGSTDDTDALNATITACPDGGLIFVPDGNYVISSEISVSKAITFIGQGMQTTILNFANCDGFLVTVDNVKFQDMRIYSTSTDGVDRTGIHVDNALTNIYNFQIENVDVSEWATSLLLYKVWNMNLNNTMLSFVRKIGIQTSGLSVNNQLSGVRIVAKTNNVSGSKGIFFNGSSVASEGWMISNCLVYGFETLMHAQQMSHVYVSNCILDYAGSKGILLESSGDNVSGGWQVVNNYIAVDNGTAGIHDANTAASGNVAYGNIFSYNKIISYTYADYGILCDQNSQKNIIKGNRIINSSGFDISAIANDHIITNNICLSAIDTNILSPGIVSDNIGIVYYQRSVNYSVIGKIKITYDEAVPTAGSFNAGDYCMKVNPSVTGTAGSQYVLKGWVRITTGSAHVLNTDWVEDRALTGT